MRGPGWLFEEASHTERVRYRLGEIGRDDHWRRATNLDVLLTSLRRRLPSPEKWLYRLGLRRADALTLPGLLCIGAQKAGTTWLYENLAPHPGLFVPPHVKEVHYFDFLFHERLADYAAVFAEAGERVGCDITPNYGRLRSGRIAFVRRVMPEARLVFLMRNPIERAWSQAVMDLTTRSGRALGDVAPTELSAHFRSPAVLRNGRYTEMIDHWLAHFPEEQLLLGFYEDVQERPRELLARVFRHAGVAADVDWAAFPYAERIHAGPGAAIPPRYREELAALFGDEIRRLADRFGGGARAWGSR